MSNGEQSRNDSNAEQGSGDEDQAMQINENTIADPEPPKSREDGDELHSRSDFQKDDQALQINQNMAKD